MLGDGDINSILGVTDDEMNELDVENINKEMPILALTNSILFPGMIIPITIGRKKSVKAIDYAEENDGWVAVMTQEDSQSDDPQEKDLYHTGTVARIIKNLKMPDGSYTAIIQGKQKATLKKLTSTSPFLMGEVDIIPDDIPENDIEFDAIVQSIKEKARKIVEMSPQIPNEAIIMIENVKSKTFLLNFLASNLNIPISEKQEILEINDIKNRADKILHLTNNELKILEIKGQIESKVKKDIEKTQKDYFLNQQLKTIQEELGNNPQKDEFEKLEKRAKQKKWSEEVEKRFYKEFDKLKKMNPHLPEYSVTLNYLELFLDLPWNEYSKDNFDLKKVKKILDKDHYGLEDVKERIIEHLAVLKIKGDMKAPILCLVGPPGVGKTSLGKSIAGALSRKFIRMSLGGLHDESEIRGHRKTYIGALPGRIIQSIKKVNTSNPVFILDEIDKVGNSFRGDPSSALLEVLDPEQNTTFHDNYLDVEYDLSKVLFVATANSLNSIQPALLDRMETIHLSGYSTEEKLEIAKRHLVPQQLEAHGLNKSHLSFNKAALTVLIEKYTRESGVRNLNRVIAKVMRNIAKKVAMEEEYNPKIDNNRVVEILGAEKFSKENAHPDDLYLIDEFAKRGISADIVAWDDLDVDYKDYTHAIIRSCWDYDERIREFLDRIEHISKSCKLFNSYETILKNYDKRYLLELEELGVDIIPTLIVENGFDISALGDCEQLIIKPNISASGKNTFKVDKEDVSTINTAIDKIKELGKTPIIQKYIDNIEKYGERSAVLVDDKVLYAMKKTPKKGGFLVHEYKGGKYEEVDLLEDEKNFIQGLLMAIDYKYLYMRIDFLRDEYDKIQLLELELIEPNLFISKNNEIAKILVDKILLA